MDGSMQTYWNAWKEVCGHTEMVEVCGHTEMAEVCGHTDVGWAVCGHTDVGCQGFQLGLYINWCK